MAGLLDTLDGYMSRSVVAESMGKVIRLMGLQKDIEYIANPDIIEKWINANRIYLDDVLAVDIGYYGSALRQEDDIVSFWNKLPKKAMIMGVLWAICSETDRIETCEDMKKKSLLLVETLKDIVKMLKNE